MCFCRTGREQVLGRGRHQGELKPCLPDAVLVGDSYAWCKGVEFDHRGDARVPVQKDLIIQSADACKRQWSQVLISSGADVTLTRVEVGGSRDQREGLTARAEEKGGL